MRSLLWLPLAAPLLAPACSAQYDFAADELAENDELAELIVEITELENSEGTVYLRVCGPGTRPDGKPFTTEECYLNNTRPKGVTPDTPYLTEVDVPADEAGLSVSIALPPGDYTVTMHHDIDDSGAMEYNFLGIPQEGYGFSQGACATLGGRPDYKDVVLTLGEEGASTTIQPDYKKPGGSGVACKN